jgi:hypothetical protein
LEADVPNENSPSTRVLADAAMLGLGFQRWVKQAIILDDRPRNPM